MSAKPTRVHPDQWATGVISKEQADSYYERHQDLSMVAVTALFSDPSLDTQAAALASVAEAEMCMAAVAELVYREPVEDGESELTPTQRAELISEHVEGARVVLRLAEAARAKLTGAERPRGAWPVLEEVAGAVLDRLADPAVVTSAEMAALYEELVPLVLEADGHAEFVQQMAKVWKHHAESERPLSEMGLTRS
ncbi:hypothetical protein JNUCC0626_50125 (plasmid) [Lentzea sp. JNUCC 0626]|uniref:hypothetical protein n=1 Tax=Lentzea sp. JNUCC 0626 TaxID=3367513 RepID=UPI0037493F87